MKGGVGGWEGFVDTSDTYEMESNKNTFMKNNTGNVYKLLSAVSGGRAI